ncbi:MAG: L-seryl-tRNA(Sec) selenium transferase, partial [Deltaproteobacteria bacterium]|nr:L-seryl-tRNA(Sec) selenium transferase [Deltaproteobacteria bacterium]
RQASALSGSRLQPVINATGIILHTNLGRAPLPPEAGEQILKVALAYSTLEYNPLTGRRSDRLQPAEELLVSLTGAEAATLVNNNAAALFLLMAALAKGRPVIVSRGELLEIGGTFRLADIIEAAGAVIIEVGSTNRTRLADYEKALAENEAAAVLKVHASNFRQIGYCGQTSAEELAALAGSCGVPLIVDAGSGTLIDLSAAGLQEEIPVPRLLAQGAAAVCFSGDKLLGAAQAGLIAGRKDIVAAVKKHPLFRTVRLDKLSLAALEATLKLAQDPREGRKKIPAWAMLHMTGEDLRREALKLKRTLGPFPGLRLYLTETESQTGGGAAPEQPLSSWAVAVESLVNPIGLLEEKLRRQTPPVAARIYRDRLLLDVRTIFPSQHGLLKKALQAAWTELVGLPVHFGPDGKTAPGPEEEAGGKNKN